MTTPQPTVAPTVEQVMAHTPGPLVLGRMGVIKGGTMHHFANGSAQSQLFMAMAGIDMPHQERDANAARMVMCWNEHDALVKSSAKLRAMVEALAVDAERLDWLVAKQAWIQWTVRDGSIRQCQVYDQDEDENYLILSGEDRYFNTPREAIDAARTGIEPVEAS